jgi:hypothetical protein
METVDASLDLSLHGCAPSDVFIMSTSPFLAVAERTG